MTAETVTRHKVFPGQINEAEFEERIRSFFKDLPPELIGQPVPESHLRMIEVHVAFGLWFAREANSGVAATVVQSAAVLALAQMVANLAKRLAVPDERQNYIDWLVHRIRDEALIPDHDGGVVFAMPITTRGGNA